MSALFRYAAGTITGLVAVLMLPLSAAAQGDPDPAPTTLRLSVSSFGGYESDVTGVSVDPERAPSAPYGGSNVALSFQHRTDKIAFSSRGSIDYRHYRTDRPVSAVSYSGNSVLSTDITSRLNVSASISSLYSPRFMFSLLPVIEATPTNDFDSVPTPLDYGLSTQSTTNISGGGTVGLRVSKRSTLSASANAGTQKLLGSNIEVRTKGYGGGYSYSMTRYATLRVGYSQMDSDYPSAFATQARRYSQRSFDVGVNYSRPLSVSRRTTLSFGSGSSAIDDGTETLYRVTGTASLRHQMRRTWEANIAYARGLGVVAGFTEPFFADSVSAGLRGRLSNRLSLQVSSGYTNGYVGLRSLGSDYVSYQASTRLEWVLQRQHLRAYGNYHYYSYEFGSFVPTATAIPRRVDRHGVRAGLIFRFPLIQERTRRVTR